MISYWFDPPAEDEVKRSYATSATTEFVLCDHTQVVGIDLIAESCLFKPAAAAMFVNVLTPPDPAVHDHVVAQATVVPLKDVRWAHCEPEAPLMPH